jgi:ABC-type dipeptide/oligopeptide/nickel transport system ATPase component
MAGKTLYPVLRGVDLVVPAAAVTTVVGVSGGGKTMLAHAIMRLLPQSARILEGEILLSMPDGSREDLLHVTEKEFCRIRGRRIGMVFQEPAGALNPVMRVGVQVAEAIRLHSPVSRAAAWADSVALLQKMGLPQPAEYARRYPHQLSGGMQQRVGLAIALAAKPALLIADEPTSALDVTVQAEILALLRELRERMSLSILLITHDWGVVAETADYVAVLDAGRVVEHRPVAEMFAAPQTDASRRLLGAARQLRAGTSHG